MFFCKVVYVYIYVINVRRSLAAVGGRFRGLCQKLTHTNTH